MRARSLGSPPGEVSRRGTTTRNYRIQCGNDQRPNDVASSAAHSVSRFPSPTSPCECGEGSGVGVLSFNTLGLSLLNHPPPRLAQRSQGRTEVGFIRLRQYSSGPTRATPSWVAGG